MSIPPFLSKVLIRTSKERDELPWLPLSYEETKACIDVAAFDIDFFLLQANATTFFSDDASLRLLFNNDDCEIVKSPYRQKLYSVKAPSSFVVGKVGNFYISILPNDNDNDNGMSVNDNESDDECDNENDDFEECTYEKVKEAFASCVSGPYSLQQFTAIILNNFGAFDIVVYRIGQKAPLNDVANTITELKRKYYIEIALAMVLTKKDHFISAKPQKSFKNYSFLLSSKAANLSLKGNHFPQMPGCFRLTAYSTSFHARKKCKSIIEYEGGCAS